jgi:hypothetical protein
VWMLKMRLVETTINCRFCRSIITWEHGWQKSRKSGGRRWFWIELDEYVDFQESILLLYLFGWDSRFLAANLVQKAEPNMYLDCDSTIVAHLALKSSATVASPTRCTRWREGLSMKYETTAGSQSKDLEDSFAPKTCLHK